MAKKTRTLRALVEMRVEFDDTDDASHAIDQDALIEELKTTFQPDDDLGILSVEVYRVVSGHDSE